MKSTKALSGEALEAGADGEGDHVLLQAFVVANARVTASREHVDKALFGDHFQADVGVAFQERCDDRWQHRAGFPSGVRYR